VATTITDIRGKVLARIQDSVHDLTTTPDMECDVDRCITAAKEEYQKQRPRELSAKVDGDGTFEYALPAGFVDRFSRIRAVFYPHPPVASPWPYGPAGRGRKPLDEDKTRLVRTESGLRLRFLEHTPGTSEDFLVEFTAPHSLDEAACTLPVTDDEALADLAAANCCDAMAARYGQETDPNLQTDVVNRLTKAAEWRSMGTRYRKSYDAKMTLKDPVLPYLELRRA